jgi:fucose 4-O-acetylase-like acetyltransferase
MGVSPAWRVFRRMNYSAFAAAALIYAAGAVHAWRVLPGADAYKSVWILAYPGIFFLAALVIPLAAPPIRRRLQTHVWISFRTGFGQSVISVLAVVLVLAVAAAFIYFDTAGAMHGGRFPTSAFAAYATGVGVLLAQALMVRHIERDPALRQAIEGAA